MQGDGSRSYWSDLSITQRLDEYVEACAAGLQIKWREVDPYSGYYPSTRRRVHGPNRLSGSPCFNTYDRCIKTSIDTDRLDESFELRSAIRDNTGGEEQGQGHVGIDK